MSNNQKNSCFGFFGGENNQACIRCSMTRRCKAVFITNGFDVLGDWADEMTANLPLTNNYPSTDRLSEMVSVLQNPGQLPNQPDGMPFIPV